MYMRLSKFPISARACHRACDYTEHNQNSMRRVISDVGDPFRFNDATTRPSKKFSLVREKREFGGVRYIAEYTCTSEVLWEGSAVVFYKASVKARWYREECYRYDINSYGWISHIIRWAQPEFISRFTCARRSTDTNSKLWTSRLLQFPHRFVRRRNSL